jgi:hypothetical protein
MSYLSVETAFSDRDFSDVRYETALAHMHRLAMRVPN